MSAPASSLRSDLARTQVKLDAMSDRAVIIDEYGAAWQKSGYVGYWYRAFDADGVDSFALAQWVGKAEQVYPAAALGEKNE